MTFDRESVELLCGATYFDTSAWNALAKHAERDQIVRRLQQRNQIVVASVIAVGEVLCTKNLEQRRLLVSTMQLLHGDRPLLEHPLDLARAAAEAFINGEQDYPIAPSGPGNSLHAFMLDPTNAAAKEISDWLHNMDGNLNRFIEAIRPATPDRKTKYHSAEVSEREDFLDILCSFPPARALALSIPQMRELCNNTDLWKALAGTFAYIISLSTTYSPKKAKGKKRPGGPDLWQCVYLGAVEAFVASDTRLLEAASEVSALLKYPRHIVHTDEFVNDVFR